MKKTLLHIVLLFFISQHFFAQDDNDVVTAWSLPVRNSLKFNRYVINPTFSFVREQNKYISFTNKKQWVQFDDAPETYLASYSGRLKENIGVGVGVFQQQYGVLTTFGGVVNFAYNAMLNRESNLTFGVNLGYYQSGLNTGRVVTNFPDPSLNNVPSSSVVAINPGINYGTTFLDFGISVKNAVAYNINTSEIIENNPEQGIQGHVMYTGYMTSRGFFDDAKFSGLLRSEFKSEETIVSGIMMLSIPKGIWGQLGYNSLYGVSAGLGVNITEQIALEYNYEQSIGDLSAFGNSHDITLAYRFKNKNRYIYSGDDKEEALLSGNKRRRSPAKTNPVTEADKQAIADAKKKSREEAIERARVKAETRAMLAAEAKAKRDAKIKAYEDKKAKAQQALRVKAEEQAKIKLAEEAKVKAEEQAKIKLAEEAKVKAEEQAKIKLAEEAKAKAEEQAKIKLAEEVKAKAEELAEIKLAEEAKAKAEEQAKIKLAEETKIKAEELAKIKLAEEAKIKAEELAKIKLAEEAKAKAEELAEIKLAEEAKVKAKEQAEVKLAEEAKAKAEEQAKIKLAEEAKAKAEELAKIKLAEEAKVKAEEQAEIKLAEEAKVKAEEQAKIKLAEEAKVKAEEQAKIKLAEEAKVKAEEQAKIKLAEEAKAKAEEQAKIKLAEEVKAKAEELAEIKLAEEAKAKAEEQAKIKLAEETKIKAEELAKIKLAEEAKIKAEELAKIKLAEEAKAKAEELAEIKLAEEAKAKAEEQAKIKLAEEAKGKAEEQAKIKLAEEAKAKAEEQAKIKLVEEAKVKAEEQEVNKDAVAENEVLNPINIEEEPIASTATDNIAVSLNQLNKIAQQSSIEQRKILVNLTESVAYKQETLDELKEENDLSDQGIVLAPKAFKSISAENAKLEALKIELDNIIKSQSERILELETLYKKRLKKIKDKNDVDNLFFEKEIQKLKSNQSEVEASRVQLIYKLATIKVATEVERKRRIKRAAYDNDKDQYLKDRNTLNRIKKFTKISTVPLTTADFDFGEKQSGNIQIVKNIKNVEDGYYLVIAVHSDVEKRDEFLRKAVAAGQTNINFFHDVTHNKYFIYYEKFDSINQAKNAMSNKSNEPYNINMSMVKIEN
ncbi:hypothetical protein GCM10022291_23360 [Postechiella marina]|uniref:Type IX secretion system membrane protein PorP/SprF n=1 Tax=Postechiella marina TaxID=943941 RepID=A0ABP8CBM9_9FLAO